MYTRRVGSVLCTVICAGVLMLALGSQYGAAQDDVQEFLPVIDGTVFDTSPFDGIGEGVEDTQGNVVSLNSGIAETRATMEFDVSAINPNRIQSATLIVESLGTGVLPGITTIPVQVFGYEGDGSIQNDDFNAGTFVTTFESFSQNVPIPVDVTEFLRSARRNKPVAFTLRTNVHGVQLNYGSLEQGFPPRLVVTLK